MRTKNRKKFDFHLSLTGSRREKRDTGDTPHGPCWTESQFKESNCRRSTDTELLWDIPAHMEDKLLLQQIWEETDARLPGTNFPALGSNSSLLQHLLPSSFYSRKANMNRMPKAQQAAEARIPDKIKCHVGLGRNQRKAARMTR